MNIKKLANPPTNQHDAWSVIGSLGWAMTVISMDRMVIPVTNVVIENSEMRSDFPGQQQYFSTGWDLCFVHKSSDKPVHNLRAYKSVQLAQQ
jgi:hypothetical protein